MSESYTITFSKDEWLPVTRDGKDYSLTYSYVPTALVGQPEEESNTNYAKVVVGISRTLAEFWNVDVEDLRKVLFEYVKRHLKEKVEEKSLGGNSEIQLTTYNAPQKCPFNPSRIDINFKKPMRVDMPAQNPIAVSEPTTIPSQIIYLRDSINAIFGEKFNGRILSLPQERHLVELFKECKDLETFAYRIASICGLATAINSSDLNKYVSKIEERKPLNILGAFLRDRYSEDQVNPIMDALKNFNNLRQMYPVHTDRAKGVLKAHRFFNLDYPVRDYASAGRKLLEAYRDILERFLGLLKT